MNTNADAIKSVPADKIKIIPLTQIEPPHLVKESKKLTAITDSMRADGWQGRPLLVLEWGDGYKALTGSHRMQAAKHAGLEEIPCYFLDAPYSLWDRLMEACGDDEAVIQIMIEHCEDKIATDLMGQEIINNA